MKIDMSFRCDTIRHKHLAFAQKLKGSQVSLPRGIKQNKKLSYR